MRFAVSKKDTTQAVLLAFSEDDVRVIEWLWKSRIVWGFYKMAKVSDKNKTHQDIVPFLNMFPDLKGIGWLSSPQGFVPHEPRVEL